MASSSVTSVMQSPCYAATLYPTSTGAMTVSQFFESAAPTSPLAICISGGGSRAMAAALGQLQALEALQANGASLLSQARVVSTVSGASWIGVPFCFLADEGDADFLGAYTPPGSLTDGTLGNLPPDGIGQQITTEFSPPALAVKALILYHDGVPTDMLWQTLIALHMLAPFDLYTYQQGGPYAPTTFFSLNQERVTWIQKQTFPGVTTQNSSLPSGAYIVASPAGQQRPYLICNTAVLVNATAGSVPAYAPVQITPVMTGVVGQPPATDTNGFPVGGGGVESFAFSSTPQASSSDAVAADQLRQWTLADAVGSSSAFFAAELEKRFALWRSNPAQFAADLGVHGPPAIDFLERHGVGRPRSEQLLSGLAASSILRDTAVLEAELSGLADLSPRYTYWPVASVPDGKNLNASFFADGGSLENSGIASALAYSDITTVIAFVNSMTKLEQGNDGWIRVDTMIPPLFGMQPYDSKSRTYTPYAGASHPTGPTFQNNCIFERTPQSNVDMFKDLCQGLWNASGSGKFTAPAIYQQTLTTIGNEWFGVSGGRTVTVLWVYLEYAGEWHDAITDSLVKLKVDALKLFENFPHFNTLHTELSGEDINLLTSLTAWVVETNASVFRSLFPVGSEY